VYLVDDQADVLFATPTALVTPPVCPFHNAILYSLVGDCDPWMKVS